MGADDKEKLKAKIQEDKDFTSNRLSELSRYISFGTLAVIFSILSSESIIWKKLQTDHKMLALYCALFGITSIFLDFLQYVFGYFTSCKAASGSNPTYKYDKSWMTYRLRKECFWTKQYSAALSGILLLVIILLSLI